ncbi:restriction endonuclease subunit S [Cuspidothrix issatschenkoi]|uniref:Restriction endonuclease subunit S n=1 Tax=Cuspidothrix issatschenkoi CHARLIE-1 TaxID=2052836 RepID=A0A2S6CU34_9CYAN|nr:restriction endonuclease subunit S [Cuspidothrix issatschenkoi]PPJ63246.1 restriction endonuclease subunit S [Cuspidothrix issatschenkoi CHARLIE-1]
MKQACLGDLVKIVGGGTPSRAKDEYYNGCIPWITVKDFGDEIFLRKSQETITKLGLKESSTNLIPAGNIILITRMAVGKVAINLIDVAINQDLKALICKPELYPKYLLFFLLSRSEYLNSQADGATVKGITVNTVEELKIPLPPLPEQKRIAAILEKCDRLRRTRRYSLQLSETFLQSVFLEMFGDPVTNPKNWKEASIREIADIIVPTRDKPKHFRGDIPWITLPDLNSFFIGSARNLLTHEDAAEVGNRLMPINTVLLSCAGSLGKVVVTTREVYANQQFYGLVAKSSLVNHLFLAISLIILGEDFFFQLAGISTIGFFSKDKALEIKIPLPPLPLQEKFAQIVQKHERFRTQQREAERQAEHLFQTLLHRAFRGELTDK